MEKAYIAIDLKSFYASVECVDRELNPLTANLVVADPSRTEKTICLAVTPSLKAYGIPGRARLFEVIQKVDAVNRVRQIKAPGRRLTGKSIFALQLDANPSLGLDFIIAPPRMAHYMDISTEIYNIYLKYIAPEDIHVYSIDEVFIDATAYLRTYGVTARELAMRIIRDVLDTTGITATVGIGTNLYLCKIAMDIEAKHIPADKDGVRIAELDEMSYRQKLWEHRPLTDFWRIGHGYASKLEKNGMYTMGDIARMSLVNEALFYKLFGINAELLIDHAWGWEPCTMEEIHSYRSETNSLSTGQVLKEPYNYEKGRLIVREMTDLLVLDLVDKRLVTDQIVLTIGYDSVNMSNAELRSKYKGEVKKDFYGRETPKHAHGSINLGKMTSSTKIITDAVMELYSQIVDENLMLRRMSVCANHVVAEGSEAAEEAPAQLDLFTDYESLEQQRTQEKEMLKREKSMQHAVLDIKKRFGKNAIIKGMNLREGATTVERNSQIGGHKV